MLKTRYLDLRIRNLQPSDVPTVAFLLTTTLHDSLIQKLGPQFIQKYFLPSALTQNGLHNYVCELDDKIMGYLLFAKSEIEIQQLGRKIRLAILLFTLRKFSCNPRLLIDLFSVFFNKSVIEKHFETAVSGAIYLVYFSIDPQFQGHGLGSKALSCCLGLLDKVLSLPNDGCITETKNPLVIKFYKKNGFDIIGTRKRFFDHYTLLFRASPQRERL